MHIASIHHVTKPTAIMNISISRGAAATRRSLTAGVAFGLAAGLISLFSLEIPALAQATAPGVRQVRIPRAGRRLGGCPDSRQSGRTNRRTES